MSDINLSELTVIELRKVAKEMKVPLQAGISKQGIIDKLTAAMAEQSPAPAEEPSAAGETEVSAFIEAEVSVALEEDEPVPPPDAAEDANAESTVADAPQPQFKQAYVAPQRFNNRPAYQAPAYNRTPAARTSAPMESQRPQNTRPVGFQSRFGPAATQPPRDTFQEEERPRQEQSRHAFGPARTNYNEATRFNQPAFEPRPSFEPAGDPARQSGTDTAPFTVNPTIEELVQAVDAPDVTGVLELLPEGFGFLRSESMLASNKDVYVSPTQIRRFGLHTGDLVAGSVRTQREGDKYPALLDIAQINGAEPSKAVARPSFDALTPIYPTRRIQLERKEAPQLSDLRLMDLITPIGFGQRALIQCAPNTGKNRLLTRLANVITLNHPEAEVMMLLFNETPENVTVIRESVNCQVVASTFDMPPESHLRLADLTIERAERLVEMKKDVILLVDSLTTLIRVISTAAMQQGRAIPGMINPQSLQKAKKLFGAARCIREGGSLTVIATMNTDSGAKADDSVVNEFRGAANMELVLDQTLARAGVYPPFELTRSGTRRADPILTPEHTEALKLLRGMIGRLPVETALREFNSMLEKAPTNEELISRIKVWVESMKG